MFWMQMSHKTGSMIAFVQSLGLEFYSSRQVDSGILSKGFVSLHPSIITSVGASPDMIRLICIIMKFQMLWLKDLCHIIIY